MRGCLRTISTIALPPRPSLLRRGTRSMQSGVKNGELFERSELAIRLAGKSITGRRKAQPQKNERFK